MIDAIIHIGLGKCGSSALQSALSKKPIQNLVNSKYKHIRYVSIDKLGNLYEGRSLTERAMRSSYGYSATCSAGAMINFSNETFIEIKSKLLQLSNNNKDLIILSSEGWSIQANMFRDNDILKKIGINAHIVCYVRNPVEWINSAWWQWGAWSGNSLDEYVTWAIDKRVSNWSGVLNQWKSYVGIKNMTVRILPNDIIKDFYDFVKSDELIENSRSNSSLSGEILRFFQLHTELRPSPHNSAIDFILSDTLNLDKTFSKTPWILNESNIKKILEKTYDSNQNLMKFFDSKSREICKNDPRWWELNAFKSKNLESEYCDQDCLSIEELDKLLLSSFKSIKKLYLENLKLKKMLN